MSDSEKSEEMAWAWDDAERVAIERRLARLVGRRVERVRYVELPAWDGPSEPMWAAPTFDSLGFGLEFDLHDGTTWAFTWKHFDINIALLVYAGSLSPGQDRPDPGLAVWDVGEHWRTSGPDDIATVTPVWTRNAVGPGFLLATGEKVSDARESALCLATLVLTSRDRREAIVTLGERDIDGNYRLTADNLAVFFSIADARAAGVLMPGDAEAATS